MTKIKPTLNEADIELLKGVFAIKNDLRGLAAKDDLKGFVTKDDLKKGLLSLKTELIEKIDEESVFTIQTIQKIFEEYKLYTHEARIKVLEEEMGIAQTVN